MGTPLTAEALADALDVFWGAALHSTRVHGDMTANAVISGIAEGIAGVAERLRENARDAAEANAPDAAVPDALRIWANAADASAGDPMYEAARAHVREMLKIRPQPEGERHVEAPTP